MGYIKSRYTLKEAAEYLRRNTETAELSVDDIVALAAEGMLNFCFPYRGKLGLFKNHDGCAEKPADKEIAKELFGRAIKTVYFNGILRSLNRPSPSNEITDLRGHTRKAHILHPVRVAPVFVSASDPPAEGWEIKGHHWRRVHGTGHSWASTQLMSGIPEAEWMVEAECLHALVAAHQMASATGFLASRRQQEFRSFSGSTHVETPEQRQDRRLARLHELGGRMEKQGAGWITQGPSGVLAQLVREEKDAMCPMRDRTDVRKDLIAATVRLRDGKTHSTMKGENSPKHPLSALEDVWRTARGS